MNFGCLKASASELCVSKNPAASCKGACWVRLTPNLTLKSLVSKQTRNVILPYHNHICHMHPLTIDGDGSVCDICDMICVVTSFIWGQSLAIVTDCSIVGSTNCFLASSWLACIRTCRNIINSIWNWHIWNVLIKSFQRRYNLSLLDNSNYQTLTP